MVPFQLSCFGLAYERSPRWRAVERAHLAQEPECAACGTRAHLQAHHLLPFHLFPERELDPSNLMTLCQDPGGERHHLEIGHRGSWQDYDPNAREAAAARRRLSPG